MKTLPIEHPELGTNKLELKVSSFLGSPRLYYNDIQVPKINKTYSLSDKIGKQFNIELKNNAFDTVPKVIINNEKIDIVTSFKWYEYIWMGLPILLVLQGGALGAIMGIIAYTANNSIFRSNRKTIAKYLLTLILNSVVIVAFVFFAMIIRETVNGLE